MTCDIVNSYLNTPCRDNSWFAAGLQHVPKKTGKIMVMVWDLYGLKSRGADQRKMSTEKLRDIYFVPTVADPHVYGR